jgi:hypothetical protein
LSPMSLDKTVTDVSGPYPLDANSGLHKTAPVQTHRTRKTIRPIVLYPATERHPAQTQLVTEDVLAGYWNTIKQSGALPKPRKQELAERVETLLQAVKQAREAANDIDEVKASAVANTIFSYLLAE